MSKYPKVYQIGHVAIRDIFEDPVVVQEKVDGSQISFGNIDDGLQIWSRTKQQWPGATDKMFEEVCDKIRARAAGFARNFWYSGEFLSAAKHNVLRYAGVPRGSVALFDVCVAPQRSCYLSPSDVQHEAARLDLGCVPTIFTGTVTGPDQLRAYLERESFFGGTKIEGVVVKNYGRFGRDGKPLFGKFVSEQFKEVHQKSWRARHPTQGDVLDKLVAALKTEARWLKAVQHLRERGELELSPRDIEKLVKEVQADILKEEKDRISEVLFKHFWRRLQRRVVGGLAEWYKQQLLEVAFHEGN